MIKDTLAYCESCDEFNTFIIKENEPMTEEMNGIIIKFTGPRAYCSKCNSEVYPAYISDSNLAVFNKLYREKVGLISMNHINELIHKYNLSSTTLSEILCVPEIKVIQCLKGRTPSKELSDKFKKIYQFLKENNFHKCSLKD